jgi:hypothetical protein
VQRVWVRMGWSLCVRCREGEEPFANGEDVDEGTLWAATATVTEHMRRVSPYDTAICSRQLTVVAKAAVESKPATILPDVNELRADTPTFVYVVWLTADGWNRPWSGRSAQTHVAYTWGGGDANPTRGDPVQTARAAAAAQAQQRFYTFRLGACTALPGEMEGERSRAGGVEGWARGRGGRV